MTKLCNKCKQFKELTCFCKNSSAKDGLQRTCRECNVEQQRAWRAENKHRNKITARKNSKTFYSKHGSKHKQYEENNLNRKLANRLRGRFYLALKRGTKTGSAVRDLGCSIEDFKKYLESKFEFEMNWNNYGKWHIDHIIPLAAFDLNNRVELLKACHYTNLQPLWAKDNLEKSDKYSVK